MILRIDENPNNLCLLLFIRSAWRIASDVDVPPLDSEPDPGNSSYPWVRAPKSGCAVETRVDASLGVVSAQ